MEQLFSLFYEVWLWMRMWEMSFGERSQCRVTYPKRDLLNPVRCLQLQWEGPAPVEERRGGQMPLGGCEDSLPLPLSSEGTCTGATRRPHIQLGRRFRLDFLSAAAPHSTCTKSKHLGLMWVGWISGLILLFVSLRVSMCVCEVIFLEYFISFLNLWLILHPYNLLYEVHDQ